MAMDWWIKLKDKIFRLGGSKSGGRDSDRREPRLPSVIVALCSINHAAAFTIEITSLSVSGMKITSPRRMPSDSEMQLRVPVGLNFESRDTQEFINIGVRSVWSRKRSNGPGFEAGVRYLEAANDKRDRWVELVLQTYGMSLSGDRRTAQQRFQVTLPVTLVRHDRSQAKGEVRNISLGGLRVSVSGAKMEMNEQVQVYIIPDGRPPMRLPGRVVHIRNEAGAASRLYGLALDDLDHERHGEFVGIVTELTNQAAAMAAGTYGGHGTT